MSGWSMVWFAPVWRSSGGRSAVSRTMGTPSVAASTTAGRPLATAVPEVVIQAAGRPVARAWPSAAKAVPRSSKWIRLRALSFAASAARRGVEREPGATQKKSMPQRRSSSTIRYAQRRLARGVSLFKPEHPCEVADLLLDLGPLLVSHTIPEPPAYLRPEVPSPRQHHLRDTVLDLQLFTERLQRLPYTFAYVSVLGAVFSAVQQVLAQPFVLRRRYSTRPGPRHSLALYRAPLTAEETFGRSPEKRRPTLRLGVEMEAARRSRLQALQ